MSFFKGQENYKTPKKLSKIKKSIAKKRSRIKKHLNTWKCDHRVLSGIKETLFFHWLVDGE